MHVRTSPILQALHYLAQVPSNRPLMKNEVRLLISIRRIMNRYSSGGFHSNVVYSMLHQTTWCCKNNSLSNFVKCGVTSQKHFQSLHWPNGTLALNHSPNEILGHRIYVLIVEGQWLGKVLVLGWVAVELGEQ